MPKTAEQLAHEKALVARIAAGWVRPGMFLGIGSGSTVALFVEALGHRSKDEGFEVRCVVASGTTAKLAESAGLVVTGFEPDRPLDLVVDGADEIDPGLNLTKGGGGALLRERIVAAAGRFVLIIGDSSKPVERLGRFALPVEVFAFGAEPARTALEDLGCAAQRRVAASRDPFVTDEGNWIFDCRFETLPDAQQLATALADVPALAAHGLFLGIADAALIADGESVFVLLPGLAPAPLKTDGAVPFTFA
jgi:ribose 5-phosphate isomerase A